MKLLERVLFSWKYALHLCCSACCCVKQEATKKQHWGGRHHLLLLRKQASKQAHGKRDIAESLHVQITRARLTACKVGVFSREISQLLKIRPPPSFRRHLSSSPVYFREITVHSYPNVFLQESRPLATIPLLRECIPRDKCYIIKGKRFGLGK